MLPLMCCSPLCKEESPLSLRLKECGSSGFQLDTPSSQRICQQGSECQQGKSHMNSEDAPDHMKASWHVQSVQEPCMC